jgi:hypothetical protein
MTCFLEFDWSDGFMTSFTAVKAPNGYLKRAVTESYACQLIGLKMRRRGLASWSTGGKRGDWFVSLGRNRTLY